MRIVIVAKRDRQRLTTAVRYAVRWQLRAAYALGTVAVTLGLVLAATWPPPGLADAVLVAAGLLCFAYPLAAILVVRRRQRATAASDTEFEIDDDGMTVRQAGAETTLRWTTLERAAIVDDELLLVWVTRRRFVVVPIGPLSAEHAAELRDLLERRGLLRRARPDLWTTSEPDPR